MSTSTVSSAPAAAAAATAPDRPPAGNLAAAWLDQAVVVLAASATPSLPRRGSGKAAVAVAAAVAAAAGHGLTVTTTLGRLAATVGWRQDAVGQAIDVLSDAGVVVVAHRRRGGGGWGGVRLLLLLHDLGVARQHGPAVAQFHARLRVYGPVENVQYLADWVGCIRATADARLKELHDAGHVTRTRLPGPGSRSRWDLVPPPLTATPAAQVSDDAERAAEDH